MFCLSNCRQLVEDVFPPLPPAPVVNSILKAGEPITCNLSLTGSIDTVALPYITDAEVRLYINDSFAQQMAYTAEGNYVSEILAEPLQEYRLEINIPGHETVYGAQTLPTADSVYNVVYKKDAFKDEEGQSYPAVSFSFKNEITTIRYYEVVLYTIRDSGEASITSTIQQTDPILLAEGLPLTIFSTNAMEADHYTMSVNYRGGSCHYYLPNQTNSLHCPIVVEFRSITFDYYQFIKQRQLYESGRYPEIVGGVVTAFPFHSNIENGYGIFAGYSLIKSDTIFPNQP